MRIGLSLSRPHQVYASFAIYSFAMGNIFPRLGDVQTQMGVTTGALGLGLIGAPIGTLLTLTFATPFLERTGFRPALLAAIPLVALLYAIAVQAIGLVVFFFLLLPVGMAIGCVEIMINTEADRVAYLVGLAIRNGRRCASGTRRWTAVSMPGRRPGSLARIAGMRRLGGRWKLKLAWKPSRLPHHT